MQLLANLVSRWLLCHFDATTLYSVERKLMESQVEFTQVLWSQWLICQRIQQESWTSMQCVKQSNREEPHHPLAAFLWAEERNGVNVTTFGPPAAFCFGTRGVTTIWRQQHRAAFWFTCLSAITQCGDCKGLEENIVFYPSREFLFRLWNASGLWLNHTSVLITT